MAKNLVEVEGGCGRESALARSLAYTDIVPGILEK
jgi:hypothetical protein